MALRYWTGSLEKTLPNTCNVCLLQRKQWADKNPEKVQEMWQKWNVGHTGREKINKYRKCISNQFEVDCAVCGCKVKPKQMGKACDE